MSTGNQATRCPERDESGNSPAQFTASDKAREIPASDDHCMILERSIETADWFRAVFEGSRDAIFIVDENARFVEANPAAVELTGYSLEEIRRLTIPDMHDMTDLPDYPACFRRIMAGQPLACEMSIRRKDGVMVMTESSKRRVEIGGAAYMISITRDITERKRAEAALRESEATYRSFVENFHGVAFRGGMDFRVIFVHGDTERITGYPAEDFNQGRVHWVDLILREDLETGILKPDEMRTIPNFQNESEYRIRHRDGSIRWIREYTRNVCNASGRPIYVEGTASDITERKRVEEAWREEVERFRLLAAATRDAIYDLDLVHRRVWHNETFQERFGVPAERSIDDAWWVNSIHPEDRARVLADVAAEARERRGSSSREYRLRGADGSYVYVIDRSYALRAPDGRSLREIGALTDITERRKIEAALRQSEERLASAMEGAGLGLWDHNLITQEVIRSEGWARMLGYAPEEIASHSGIWKELLHPDELQSVLRAAADHEAGLTPEFRVEHRMRHKNGEWRWILNWGRVIERDGEGRALRAAGIHMDVTDRKKVEGELARHRAHLEELVEQGTRELEASRERARRAERLASIGTLAAGIAHEINNPLGMIMLGLEEAADATGQPAIVEKILKQAKDDVRRCARIVKSVLRFAKDETTEKWIEDLNAVIRRALDFTREYARIHQVTLAERLAGSLPPIQANATEMEQVFVNLIHNAVHASAPGSAVTIETAGGGGRVRAVVRDHGAGMSEEQLSRAFDPFYTTRLDQGGTGLGLSTCHGIITDHGGTISIQSREGQGTSVVIDLPAGQGVAGREEDDVQTARGGR
jgi:PAS domain S-box-containing protein